MSAARFRVETGRGGEKEGLGSAVPLTYKGVRVDCGYRADLIVEGSVLVELKTVERLQLAARLNLLLSFSPCSPSVASRARTVTPSHQQPVEVLGDPPA